MVRWRASRSRAVVDLTKLHSLLRCAGSVRQAARSTCLGLRFISKATSSLCPLSLYRPEDEYIPDSLPVQPRFGPYPRPETYVHTVTQSRQSSVTSSTRRPQINAYNLHQTTIHDTSAYHIKREPKT